MLDPNDIVRLDIHLYLATPHFRKRGANFLCNKPAPN